MALIFSFLLGNHSFAAEINKADQLFDKGEYSEALKEYDVTFKHTNHENARWQAFCRGCECLTHLFRYGEAAERLLKTPLPQDLNNRARVLLFKAELLRNFLSQYASIQRKDVVDEPGKELFRLTLNEIRNKIKSTYEELWQMRETLISMKLAGEGYFIEIKNADLNRYPTMFDYLILSWTSFLLAKETNYVSLELPKPPAKKMLEEEFDAKIDLTNQPALLAADIMMGAASFKPENRLQATELWQIERLLLPLNYSGLFKEDKKYKKEASSILLAWLEKFKTNEGRAEAGYQAAKILGYDQAVKICDRLNREFGKTHASQRATQLATSIKLPQLELKTKVSLPPAANSLLVESRNLKDIYWRVYKIDPYKLKQEYLALKGNDNFNGWGDLLSLYWVRWEEGEKWLKKYLSNHKPTQAWSDKTGDKADYRLIQKTYSPPALDQGLYLIVAGSDPSFAVGSSLVSVSVLNVTDLVLLSSTGFTAKAEAAYLNALQKKQALEIKDQSARFYLLDSQTGRPKPAGKTDVYLRYYDGERYAKELVAQVDSHGVAGIDIAFRFDPTDFYHKSYYFDPLASAQGTYAYLAQQLNFSYECENPIRFFVETDRPIYRPGDKLQAKVVAVRRGSDGFKTLQQETITIKALDRNQQEFFTKQVKLNDFGSASFELTLPKDRLLGRYSLQAVYDDGFIKQSAKSDFSIEEYKQPEFELSLMPAKEPWQYHKGVKIKGEAKYYFGGPVPGAPVNYRIKRQVYVPWYYRFWLTQDITGDEELAAGQIITDKDGKFEIPFTPTQAPQDFKRFNIPDLARFIIEVEARDAGGRTIKSQQTYQAGEKGLYFVIEPEKGFFRADETMAVKVDLLTVNETGKAGVSRYSLFRLVEQPAKPLSEIDDIYKESQLAEVPPLEIQLKEVPNAQLLVNGSVTHDHDGRGLVKIVGQAPGVYRLVLKTKDQWGQDIEQNKILVVAGKKEDLKVRAAAVTLVEQPEYQVGDTARFIIGSGLGAGVYWVEIWQGQYLVEHRLVDQKAATILIEIPVTAKLKGGFVLRWFGVKDFKVYSGQTMINVPWREKELAITLEPFNKELLPGASAHWGINVKDKQGKPEAAEVLALMYDRALEYYMAGKDSWLESLYYAPTISSNWLGSVTEQPGRLLNINEGLLEKLLQYLRQPVPEPELPHLRAQRTWVVRQMPMLALSRAKGKDADVGAPEGAVMLAAPSEINKEGAKGAGLNVISPRKYFADTAFFKPHLLTKNGLANLSFTAPEQLTSWQVKFFALTPDLKHGRLVKEAVTRKDLMVRLDLPRFFREKDQGTITALVHNESANPISGQLLIEVKENSQLINQRLGLSDNQQNFTVKPHSLASFNWLLKIPSGVSNYKIKVAAKAGELTDAEERELPILPSRERLIESVFTSLAANGTKTLRIDLDTDPTRLNEKMVLQLEPQLALTVLNTLPFLVEYPYECVEQTINKYVPLSIINKLYDQYPELKPAIKKIPERETITPAWDKNDPNRLTALMETPWLNQAAGIKSQQSLINLLKPETVAAQKELSFSKLKAAQLSNGAFPWWPGGQPDLYMTLYVLMSLAEAERYGVAVPQEMVSQALSYALQNIASRLNKPDERQVATVAFAAYVLTSYSSDKFPQAKIGHDLARNWVKFLDKYTAALTPFGKAYLAYTYYNLGDKNKANETLEQALDGAREDELAGVYWAPEKYAWVWYADTVEKHAFFLKLLQQVKPGDKRIPGMIKWLLLNRQGNVWKSTKASVAAIYAILDYLNSQGALGSSEQFKVQWGEQAYTEIVKPDDWLDKPLTWQKQLSEITEKTQQAKISKQGKGLAFASLTWIYSTDQLVKASQPGLLELERKFYRRVKEGSDYHLKPLRSGDAVKVGDQIEVQLKINTKSQFEYMHLKDLKAAGFEAETLLSGWQHDPLWFYEEPRDSLTNFFIAWLPHGEYILRYRLRSGKPGVYKIGAATLQSMYAPEMTSHSSGFVIKVEE